VSASRGRRHATEAHVPELIELVVRRILVCGISVSVALMVAGLLLGVTQGSGVPRGVVPFAELPGALAALRPAAYLSLGLIVLIATPFVRVAGALVVFTGERDRRFVLVTAIVLLVMCLGVALGRL
jgi:uncharacterized membrane protein